MSNCDFYAGFDYAADGQILAETIAFNTSLFTLHEKFDTFGRDAGYALSNEVAQITGTMQSFDLYGRLNQVAVDGISGAFTYGYLEGSHLQKSLAMPNGVTRTFGYEQNRDLLTMIVHSNATDRLVQRDFTFDGLARLESRTLFRANETPVQPDAFAYNSRSELTNAIYQITQSGTNAIRQFSYDFDPIGNRTAATEFGTNTAYIASALNQYTSINPIDPVNLGENFTPEFDVDGNQTLLKTTTGIWHVTYNAENRPVLFSNDTTVVEMAYDYMGRRFEYKETVNNILTRHERYLYRGYLQIAALDMLTSGIVKHTIVWDPTERVATRPLSLQIGANAYFYSLDQVKNVSELFDSVGNLAATYDYSPFGQITSSSSVGSSMLRAMSNPLTFSSEVHDATLGLQYYNYRHLNLLDGRWMNRDPIEEAGHELMEEIVGGLEFTPEYPELGNDLIDLPLLLNDSAPNEVNPYVFVVNNPMGYVDSDGRSASAVPPAVAIGGAIIARELLKLELKRRAKRAAECAVIHKLYSDTQDKARACKPGMSKEEAAKNWALWSAVVAGRTLYLSKKCDYYLLGSIKKGSKKAAAGHKVQLATASAAMLACGACALPEKK